MQMDVISPLLHERDAQGDELADMMPDRTAPEYVLAPGILPRFPHLAALERARLEEQGDLADLVQLARHDVQSDGLFGMDINAAPAFFRQGHAQGDQLLVLAIDDALAGADLRHLADDLEKLFQAILAGAGEGFLEAVDTAHNAVPNGWLLVS
jgi:hypothetical protein